MVREYRPGQYPQQFYDIVEGCAVYGKMYELVLSVQDARKLRAQFNGFLGAIYKAGEQAMDRTARTGVSIADDERWINHRGWAQRTMCKVDLNDDGSATIRWVNRDRSRHAGLLEGLRVVEDAGPGPLHAAKAGPGDDAGITERASKLFAEMQERAGSDASKYLGRPPNPSDPNAAVVGNSAAAGVEPPKEKK